MVYVDTVMKANGIPEHDLRPAFLMLASCHTELKRRALSNCRPPDQDDPGTARAHEEHAHQWLRKALGTRIPDATVKSKDPGPYSPPPSQHRTRAGSMSGKLTGRDSVMALERELQTLQEKHAADVAELLSALTHKRKAESALEQERAQRLRIEEELARERWASRRLEASKTDLERQLARALRRENLEKAYREKELARRAEAGHALSTLLSNLSGALARAAEGPELKRLVDALPPDASPIMSAS